MPVDKTSGSSSDFDVNNYGGSERFETEATDKSRGIREKFKGSTHKIRDHLRLTTREGAEPSSIKKAAKSLAGKIASGASKAKEKAKGFFKSPSIQKVEMKEEETKEKGLDFAKMETTLKLNPGDELTCPAIWDQLKEIVGKVPKDPNFGEAVKTLGKLLDTNNDSLVKEKARNVLRELVQSCEHLRRQEIALPLWFFGSSSAQSIKTGIEDAFPAIFEGTRIALETDPLTHQLVLNINKY